MAENKTKLSSISRRHIFFCRYMIRNKKYNYYIAVLYVNYMGTIKLIVR